LEHPEEPDASSAPLERFMSAIARDAARVLREHPEAELTGIIAENGTIECRRVRTLLEQGTGKELANTDFAGILPTSALPKVLDHTFPQEAIQWIMDHDAKGALQIIVCTKAAVRVATVAIPSITDPEAPPDSAALP
jgi:hypothetical protein